MKNKVIIFFTRIPKLGKTKTRLEPFLSKELCVKLQMAFIEDIYNKIKDFGIDIIINHSEEGDLGILENLISKNTYFLKQEGKELGDKMYNAISFSLNIYKEVVLIGSDLPLIDKRDIDTAFNILKNKDIVLSPTYDGGYYLIGMKEENKDIFNIKYSTSSVFEETIDKVKALGKTFGVGNMQLDIDEKEDFLKLYKILKEDRDISCITTRNIVMKIMEERDKECMVSALRI